MKAAQDRVFSKSKLLALRQCPRRLWLEVRHPTWRDDSSATRARFAVGNQVGEVARSTLDRDGNGILLDLHALGVDAALERSRTLLRSGRPLFEAGFEAAGARAFADVLLPAQSARVRAWKLVEVKSSTTVKEHHIEDLAIQVFVARAAGVRLASAAVACVNTGWVYPGGKDYRGLLELHDRTQEAAAKEEQVRAWIAEARRVAARKTEPRVPAGAHCRQPFECGFLAHCTRGEAQAEHPIQWLPGRLDKGLTELIQSRGLTDMRELPDRLLNAQQLRVKTVTVKRRAHFDRRATAQALADHVWPARFLDFETVSFAVPIWKGTRPYQQIPFQFSLHCLTRSGSLAHQSFLDLSGRDPSRAFAEQLVAACGERGPIFVYNAAFERTRLNELAERFPRLAAGLEALGARIVDLLPLAREHYYHRDQQGSWSLKRVLPSLCPDLRHADLLGVKDGTMAMEAFREAIAPQTATIRKAEIERQLLDYCELDTLGLVRLWSAFSGRPLLLPDAFG